LFSPYGHVREVHVMREPNSNLSRGCAFVNFSIRMEAAGAIQALNNIAQDGSAPQKMTVKFAETQKDKSKKFEMQRMQGFGSYQPYPPQYPQMYGRPPNPMMAPPPPVDPYAAYAQRPPQPQYGAPSEQAPNLYGYNQPYYSSTPDYSAMHSQAAPSPYAPSSVPAPVQYSQAPPPLVAQQPSVYAPPPLPPPTAMATTQAMPQVSGGGGGGRGDARGPEGANVFVHGLPPYLTDQELGAMFGHYGQVLSARVFRDKLTQQPKGFGFVSYGDIGSADRAIVGMNGYMIQNKRLKVMKKNASATGRGAPY